MALGTTTVNENSIFVLNRDRLSLFDGFGNVMGEVSRLPPIFMLIPFMASNKLTS